MITTHLIHFFFDGASAVEAVDATGSIFVRGCGSALKFKAEDQFAGFVSDSGFIGSQDEGGFLGGVSCGSFTGFKEE